MDRKIIFFIISFLLVALTSCSTTTQFMQQHFTPTTTTTRGGEQSSLSDDSQIWKSNPQSTWSQLQFIPVKTLENTQSSNPDINAWLKLATISKRYSNTSRELVPQLIAWRQENPNHPANALFPNDATLEGLVNKAPVKKVVVLLPLRGQYKQSGSIVREGFFGGYYHALSKGQPVPTVSFSDTSQGNVIALYQQAIGGGADNIVGPLLKPEVQAISHQTIPVQTLGLNYTDSWGTLPTNLYEFGLSPFDEAQQVAERASAAGLNRALLIAPQTEWGNNVSKVLIAHWQSVGGTMVDTLYYTPQSNFAEVIPQLLHINPKADRQQMQENNDKQTLEQQRRQDFNVIFLLATPNTGRVIVPLLRFYYVTNTPIYSTSLIYSGAPSPQKDNDLNGVTFCDIPLTLNPAAKGIHANRLYAVGRDAYLLSQEIKRLELLPNFPIYGATGALSLTPQHKIYHRLAWAKFHNGVP